MPQKRGHGVATGATLVLHERPDQRSALSNTTKTLDISHDPSVIRDFQHQSYTLAWRAAQEQRDLAVVTCPLA